MVCEQSFSVAAVQGAQSVSAVQPGSSAPVQQSEPVANMQQTKPINQPNTEKTITIEPDSSQKPISSTAQSSANITQRPTSTEVGPDTLNAQTPSKFNLHPNK